MRGNADAAFLATNGIEAPEALVRGLESDLRALLRDAIAGHLPADLRGVADEILSEPASFQDARARPEPDPEFVVTRVEEPEDSESPTQEHETIRPGRPAPTGPSTTTPRTTQPRYSRGTWDLADLSPEP